ncbi:MAG: nucleoside phosphorylase [Haloglomus sp.]
MPVPLHDAKYDSEPVIDAGAAAADAESRGNPRPDAPDAMLLCYNPDLLVHLVETYDGEELPGQYFGGGCYRLPGVPDTDEVGVVGEFGIGAPVTAMVVESLLESGTERFCICGRSGILAADGDGRDRVPESTAVVANAALRDEGTSYHYEPAARTVAADETVREAVRRALAAADIDYRVGPTWTTDALFRETAAEVEDYVAAGVLTVEMEAAAAFTVARHHGAAAGAVFVPSDYVTTGGWDPLFGDDIELLRETGEAVVRGIAAAE